MKGISVWIWVVAGFIMGIILFATSLQFITFITTAKQKELAKESLDTLASNVNGICNNRAGDSFMKSVDFPEKVTKVYATKDTSLVPNQQRTYGNNLCMNFSNELICDNVECNLEMDAITSGENLQSLLNRFLGRYGTNSYDLEILKTDCGVALLSQNSQSTCALNNTLT